MSRWFWAVMLGTVLGACSNGPKPFVDIDKDIDRWDELGVPVVGTIAVKILLTSPKDEYASATGTAMVSCAHCVFGDGGTLKPTLRPGADPRTQAFAGAITVPVIEVGAIEGGANFKDGVGTVELKAGNPDTVEAELAGTVKLANNLADSMLDLHLRFRTSEKLRETNVQGYNLLNLTGASRGDDGWFKIHITGPASNTRRMSE